MVLGGRCDDSTASLGSVNEESRRRGSSASDEEDEVTGENGSNIQIESMGYSLLDGQTICATFSSSDSDEGDTNNTNSDVAPVPVFVSHDFCENSDVFLPSGPSSANFTHSDPAEPPLDSVPSVSRNGDDQVPKIPAENEEIVLNDAKIVEIKNFMSKISIPTSRFPPWATEIPEQEWKRQLMEKLAAARKDK
ncbi:unnamed protein product [Calicophoron daubneyi]|uniref:Male-enhanced antigen 1 n=1 Tax=Calicophoron daubneyi TaxID=300641 RepID=A0AAV2SZY8_CALDB